MRFGGGIKGKMEVKARIDILYRCSKIEGAPTIFDYVLYRLGFLRCHVSPVLAYDYFIAR